MLIKPAEYHDGNLDDLVTFFGTRSSITASSFINSTCGEFFYFSVNFLQGSN